jgi:hypothetical protein
MPREGITTMTTSHLPPKIAFTAIPGLPGKDDPELLTLMATVEALPRAGADSNVRCLLRAALAFERTADPEFLTVLAEDALASLRLRGDPRFAGQFDDKPGRPAAPEDLLDVEDVLKQAGL